MSCKILRHCCANCCHYDLCIGDEEDGFEFKKWFKNDCKDFGIDGETPIEDLVFDEEDEKEIDKNG
jgi:hypothetical protein